MGESQKKVHACFSSFLLLLLSMQFFVFFFLKGPCALSAPAIQRSVRAGLGPPLFADASLPCRARSTGHGMSNYTITQPTLSLSLSPSASLLSSLTLKIKKDNHFSSLSVSLPCQTKHHTPTAPPSALLKMMGKGGGETWGEGK